jgi:hypothetical protein
VIGSVSSEPPKGTLYDFPPRGEVIVSVVGFPVPARIGMQMYSQGIRCKMIANLQSCALNINQGDPAPMGDGGRGLACGSRAFSRLFLVAEHR